MIGDRSPMRGASRRSAKLDAAWVEAYFEHGIDINNRRVFLGDIESETVEAAIKGLYLMETASKTEPVEVFISSYGGTVYEALALYDIINTLRCPVHTFAYGKCMSAAPLLLAVGRVGQRWVAPHVSFMHHDWSDMLRGRGTEIEAAVKHNKNLDDLWTRLLASHTRRDYQWWKRNAKRNHDFYFSAEEAIEWGLADQIWCEK